MAKNRVSPSRSIKYHLKTVTIKKGKNKGKRVKRHVLKQKYKK